MAEQVVTGRICFVATLPVTLKAFVLPQAVYLLEQGWEVTLICAEDQGFHDEIPCGVRYLPLRFKRGVDLFGVPRAIFALYRIFKAESFDLVQYSTPNAAFYASTAAWLSRVPVRLYAQWGIRYAGFKGIPRVLFKTMERWCCRCSTVIQPDSVSNLEFSVEECLYPRSKGRVIWNGSACGVDLQRFDVTQKDSWREEFGKIAGIESHHLVVGFVGSIRSDKGCNELISACRNIFSDLPDARLMLVGDKKFYDTIRQDLRDWISLSQQVIHIPPNRDIPQYMACMDVFSLPSYREGFGLVIVEAEAMGVPVVVSDVPGPVDAMRHEKTGLIVPVKDSKALAFALRALLDDAVMREKMGRAACSFVHDNFGQVEFLKRLLEDKEMFLDKGRAQAK